MFSTLSTSEILVHICSFLSLPDLSNLGQTCWNWRNLTHDFINNSRFRKQALLNTDLQKVALEPVLKYIQELSTKELVQLNYETGLTRLRLEQIDETPVNVSILLKLKLLASLHIHKKTFDKEESLKKIKDNPSITNTDIFRIARPYDYLSCLLPDYAILMDKFIQMVRNEDDTRSIFTNPGSNVTTESTPSEIASLLVQDYAFLQCHDHQAVVDIWE